MASREAYTPREVIEIISFQKKGAHRAELGIDRAVGAVPLVNLLVRVGIQEIQRTHLLQLVRAHRAATQGNPDQYQTRLYDAISKMEKDGRRFGSVKEVLEAVKG